MTAANTDAMIKKYAKLLRNKFEQLDPHNSGLVKEQQNFTELYKIAATLSHYATEQQDAAYNLLKDYVTPEKKKNFDDTQKALLGLFPREKIQAIKNGIANNSYLPLLNAELDEIIRNRPPPAPIQKDIEAASQDELDANVLEALTEQNKDAEFWQKMNEKIDTLSDDAFLQGQKNQLSVLLQAYNEIFLEDVKQSKFLRDLQNDDTEYPEHEVLATLNALRERTVKDFTGGNVQQKVDEFIKTLPKQLSEFSDNLEIAIRYEQKLANQESKLFTSETREKNQHHITTRPVDSQGSELDFSILSQEAIEARQNKFDDAATKIYAAQLKEMINQQSLDEQKTQQASLFDEKQPVQTVRRPQNETAPTTDTIPFAQYKTQKNQADENKLSVSKEQEIKKKVAAIIKTARTQLDDPAYGSLKEIKKSLRIYVQHAGKDKSHAEIGSHLATLLETCKKEPAINQYLLNEMDVTNDIQRTSFTQALLNIQAAAQNREQYDKREHEENIHAMLKNLRPFGNLRSETPDNKFEDFVDTELKALETKIRQAQVDYHGINFYNTFGFQEPIKPLIKANILKELKTFESEFKMPNGEYKENAVANFLSPHFVIPPNKPDRTVETQLDKLPTLKRSIDTINDQAESAKNRREEARKIEQERELHEQKQKQEQQEKAEQNRLAEEEKSRQKNQLDDIRKQKTKLASIERVQKETAVNNAVGAVIQNMSFCADKDKPYYPLDRVKSLLESEQHKIINDFAAKTNSTNEAMLSSNLGKLFKLGQSRIGVQHVLNSAGVAHSVEFAQTISDLNLAAQKEQKLAAEKARQEQADKALNDYTVSTATAPETKSGQLTEDAIHTYIRQEMASLRAAITSEIFSPYDEASIQKYLEQPESVHNAIFAIVAHKIANDSITQISELSNIQLADNLAFLITKPESELLKMFKMTSLHTGNKDDPNVTCVVDAINHLNASVLVNTQEQTPHTIQSGTVNTDDIGNAEEVVTAPLSLSDESDEENEEKKQDEKKDEIRSEPRNIITQDMADLDHSNMQAEEIDNTSLSENKTDEKPEEKTPAPLTEAIIKPDAQAYAHLEAGMKLRDDFNYPSIWAHPDTRNKLEQSKLAFLAASQEYEKVANTPNLVNPEMHNACMNWKSYADARARVADADIALFDANKQDVAIHNDHGKITKQAHATADEIKQINLDIDKLSTEITTTIQTYETAKNIYQAHKTHFNTYEAQHFPNHEITDGHIQHIDDKIHALQSIKNDLIPLKDNANKVTTDLNVDKFIENINARLNNMRGPVSKHVANFKALKDHFLDAKTDTQRDEILAKILKSNIDYLIDGLNGYKNALDRYEALDKAKIQPYKELLDALTDLKEVSNKAWYDADVSQACKNPNEYEDFFKKVFHHQLAPGAIKSLADLHAKPAEGTITDALSHETPYRTYAALLTDKIEAGKPISDYAAGWIDQFDPATKTITSKLITIPTTLKTETIFIDALEKAKQNGILNAYQFKGTIGFEETLKIYFQDRHVTSDTVKEFLKKHFDLSAKLSVGNAAHEARTGMLNLVRTEQKSFENRIADLICKEYNTVMGGKHGLPCDMLLKLAIKQVENMTKAQRQHGASELVFTAENVFNEKYAQALSYYCQAQGYKFTDKTKYGIGSIYQLKDREPAIQHIKALAAESTQIEFHPDKVVEAYQAKHMGHP
jgi:hypothetical protein